jgi:hypothetical protein
VDFGRVEWWRVEHRKFNTNPVNSDHPFKIIHLISFECRQKYLQIVRLVSNDNILESFNDSVPTNDLLERLHEFPDPIRRSTYKDVLYPYQPYFTWLKAFPVNFTRVLGKSGFCYTFNFPKPSEMFELEE